MDFVLGRPMHPEAARYFKEAYEHQMQGDFQQAIYFYKKSLEIEPSAEAHTFLGWTYSFMGKLDQAIEECKKAIAVDPSFGNPYNDIGAYLMQLGKLDQAIPWLKKAMAATRYENPEFPYANLARIYEMKGLWPLALEMYEKALAIRPDYDEAREAMLKLQANLN